MQSTTALPEVAATRYVTALREGGSMPGLVEADDDGLYVLKFRGAGQGPLALVAEVIVGRARPRPRLPGAAGRAALTSIPSSGVPSRIPRSRS